MVIVWMLLKWLSYIISFSMIWVCSLCLRLPNLKLHSNFLIPSQETAIVFMVLTIMYIFLSSISFVIFYVTPLSILVIACFVVSLSHTSRLSKLRSSVWFSYKQRYCFYFYTMANPLQVVAWHPFLRTPTPTHTPIHSHTLTLQLYDN